MTESFPDNSATAAEPTPPLNPPGPLLEIYRQCRAELVAFVRAKFGSGPPEPEDVVQQAFANFMAYAAKDTIVNPRAFLFRTAQNIVINDRKHQRVKRRFFAEEYDLQENCEARADWNPEVVLIGKEQYRLIEQVIRDMPEKRRRILLMNRIEGLSYAEIARRLGLSESVIRKHTALAVRECAARLLDAVEPDIKDGMDHD